MESAGLRLSGALARGVLATPPDPEVMAPMSFEVFPLYVTLSLEKARAIIAAALAEGRERRLQPLTVVVLDAGAHVVSLDREDGAGVLRQAIARGKACAALGFGVGSRTIGARNEGRDAFLASVAAASGGEFVPVAGGALVLDGEGRAIGAVGVSGDSPGDDEACAVAGIEAAGYRAGVDASE